MAVGEMAKSKTCPKCKASELTDWSTCRNCGSKYKIAEKLQDTTSITGFLVAGLVALALIGGVIHFWH